MVHFSGWMVLWIHSLDHAWEGNGLADMLDSTDPGYGSFHPHPKTGMRYRAIPAQVHVPLVGSLRQSMLVDPLEQQVGARHTLRAADDFSVPFRCQQVH